MQIVCVCMLLGEWVYVCAFVCVCVFVRVCLRVLTRTHRYITHAFYFSLLSKRRETSLTNSILRTRKGCMCVCGGVLPEAKVDQAIPRCYQCRPLPTRPLFLIAGERIPLLTRTTSNVSPRLHN